MMQLNEYELSMVNGGDNNYSNFCYYCDKPTKFTYVNEYKAYEPGTVVRCTECQRMMSKVFADSNQAYYLALMAE